MAGSFDQLAEHVIPVAPADLEGTVRAMHRALTMPREERARRASALKSIVLEQDITAWLESQLRELMETSRTTA
jgi:trehalose 6-phosphate synthase